MSVAILKASCASLKMCEDEWMFFWMDSNTVSNLRASPKEHKGQKEKHSLLKDASEQEGNGSKRTSATAGLRMMLCETVSFNCKFNKARGGKRTEC